MRDLLLDRLVGDVVRDGGPRVLLTAVIVPVRCRQVDGAEEEETTKRAMVSISGANNLQHQRH
jgi:hypothetical protein